MLTNEQVDLLEQLDDYIEWIELSATATLNDINYIQALIDRLAASVVECERKRNELDKASTWPEED